MKTLDELASFIIDNNSKIRYITISGLKRYNFNDMEGSEYMFNVNLYTTDKYKNKRVKGYVNSSYLDDDTLPNITTKDLEFYLGNCLY